MIIVLGLDFVVVIGLDNIIDKSLETRMFGSEIVSIVGRTNVN